MAHRNTEAMETKIVEKRDWMVIEGWEVVRDCKMLVGLREKMRRQAECRW